MEGAAAAPLVPPQCDEAPHDSDAEEELLPTGGASAGVRGGPKAAIIAAVLGLLAVAAAGTWWTCKGTLVGDRATALYTYNKTDRLKKRVLQDQAPCLSHDTCQGGEFCYAGYCDGCSECHYCIDGVDSTCGGCLPMMGPPCDQVDEYAVERTVSGYFLVDYRTGEDGDGMVTTPSPDDDIVTKVGSDLQEAFDPALIQHGVYGSATSIEMNNCYHNWDGSVMCDVGWTVTCHADEEYLCDNTFSSANEMYQDQHATQAFQATVQGALSGDITYFYVGVPHEEMGHPAEEEYDYGTGESEDEHDDYGAGMSYYENESIHGGHHGSEGIYMNGMVYQEISLSGVEGTHPMDCMHAVIEALRHEGISSASAEVTSENPYPLIKWTTHTSEMHEVEHASSFAHALAEDPDTMMMFQSKFVSFLPPHSPDKDFIQLMASAPVTNLQAHSW